VLTAERDVARSGAALRDQNWHGVATSAITSELREPSAERSRALASITGSSGFAILDGQAGTGKSSVLAAAKEVYEANGYRVVGLAHTNLVVQDLRDKGFSNARTIDSELPALDSGKVQWNKRTVVMIDEAAMVDTRRLAAVLRHARTTGAKVILAGDDRQLSSIERGGMFEVLKERHGAAVLTEVHRQHSLEERRASQFMAAGDFAKAVGIYEDRNAIHWRDKQSEAAEALVDTYMRDRAADPQKTRFIFAYTNREVDQINAVVREARQAGGELGESRVFDTKHGRAEIAVGERVQFTGTDKFRGIYNGYSGTVRDIRGTTVTVELDGRKKQSIEFDADAFQDFRHGYAGTIYRGQGRTIDQTYLLHSEHWRSTSSYVALTRHSEKTQLFVARDTTDSVADLARQMSRRDDRRAALAFSAVREETRRQQTAPDAGLAWRISRENYTRSAHSAQQEEQRIRKEHARRTNGYEQVPEEVRVGQLGNAADLKVDGVRSAFAEIAQKRRREREDEAADFSSVSYRAATRRWRIGRDGRQR
jgi:ATP-dependent exoDNAse (exonuclease V) alpha subunit